jgi:hypothetical protein
MLRSVGAVVTGYFIFGASAALLFQLSGQAPHGPAPLGFKVASIVWGVVSALIAGWVAARLAAREPRAHALAVAALIALGALISLVVSAAHEAWSQIAAIALMAPSAWLGGVLAARRTTA